MKRILSLIISVLIAFSALACAGVSENSSNEKEPANKSSFSIALSSELKNEKRGEDFFSAANMDSYLKKVLNITEENKNGDLGSREAYSKNEAATAELLKKLALEIKLKDSEDSVYDVSVPIVANKDSRTQNVIATKKGTANNSKQVVIGANYDNSIFYNNSSQEKSEIKETVGAMDNGTGCATLLALMEYFAEVDLEYDLVFIFFGAGTQYESGSYNYVKNMSETQKQNTLLMFNVRRLGGDYMYLYSEEVETEHNNFIMEKSNSLELGVKNIVKNKLPIIQARAVDRIPYATWAMAGTHSPFLNAHINVASITSANYETLNSSDIESAAHNNLSYTSDDTYLNLVKYSPNYGLQMGKSALLISNVLQSENFSSVMISSRENFNNYDAATKDNIAQIILIAVMIAILIAIVLIAKHLEKKYPFKPEIRKLKVAVFGGTYEDKDGDDIIIDIKKPEDNNPFDGF